VSEPTRYEPAFLLEVRLGGDEPLTFAREELILTSREAGGERVYTAGMSEVSFTLGASSASITVRRPGIATLRNRVGPLVGRPFVLRLHRGETYVEDTTVALQGLVAAAGWAVPGAPDDLALTLRRGDRELSSDVIDPQAVVTDETWPVATLGVDGIDEAISGQPYPLILGAPGRQLNDSDTSNAAPATPALHIESNGPSSYVLIAGHVVEAAEVDIWDLSSTAPTGSTCPVVSMDDTLGRTVSYCQLSSGSPVLTPNVGAKLFAGWSPRSGKGRGVMMDGEPVRGIGDVLLWGARYRSAATFDLGRMRAERQALNAYQIDAVVNQRGLRWSDWVARNILDLFDVELVSGPRGFYYRLRTYTPVRARTRATLVTDRADSGILVRRSGPVVDEPADEVVNEITVAFAPVAMSTNAFQRRVTIGPTRLRYVYGGPDIHGASSRACKRSAELFGEISRTWLVGVTHDTPTAWLLAQRLVDRYALPAQLVSYTGGPELFDLEPYDTVEIIDTVDGAALDTVYGVVQPGVTVGEREVTLTVRIPEAG
jgi:hypothetical protein